MNFRMPKIWQILKQFANNRSFLSSTNFSLQKNDVHDMVWYTILSKIIFSTLTGKICIPWAYNNVLVCKEPYYSHDMALDFRILCSWWCVPTAKKCINFFFARIKKSWSNICRSISLFIILKLVTENVLTTPA